MRLFRPVGLDELRLVFTASLRGFPPRLVGQPIFYPVLNEDYAVQIARDWNTRERAYAGYVTAFTVEDAFASRYTVHTVGARIHEELWVPAEELPAFNDHIAAPIQVTHAFFGAQFTGFIPDQFMLAGRNARAQFALLEVLARDYGMDFVGELHANPLPIFLHYPFWGQRDFSADGIDVGRRDEVLRGLERIWAEVHPALPLPRFANGSA